MAKKLPTPPKPRPSMAERNQSVSRVYDKPPAYASDNATSSGRKPKMNLMTGKYCK